MANIIWLKGTPCRARRAPKPMYLSSTSDSVLESNQSPR